jgi:hypothetical protein
MLKKKDEFFNWWGPSKERVRGGMPDVLRVYVSGKRKSLTLSASLCQKLGLNRESVRVAIVLDDETPFVTFNPKEGVPFVKMEPRGNAKSPSFNSTELAESVAHRFKLNSRCKYYDFKVVYWQKMSGMDLYKLEPIENECD